MSNISERIAALSLEQRKLLELRLKQKQTLSIPAATASATFPLSSMQQGLWLANQLYPDLPLYNESSLFKLTGIVKIDTIVKSINKIVARHDILRTTFEVDGEKVTQVIKPHLDISLTIIDNIESNSTEIQNSINYYAALPFDLKELPLLRCIIFKLSQQEHLLLITMHHLISDGWSWGVFCQELAAFYQGLSLPDLAIQYGNFTLWQQQNLPNKITSQLNYWLQKLKAAPTILELATDYLRPLNPSFKGKRETFIISKSLTKQLKVLGKEAQVTTFMLLLAAFKTLLYRYTQQTDIIVGTPIANRDRLEFEGLIGCFINTLVLRSDLGGDPSFRDLLQQIKTTTLEAYQHQDLPLEELLKALKIERLPGINPLFQVMFVYQPAPLLDFTLPDLTITSLPLDNGIAKFDLTLYIEDTQDELLGFLEYSSDLFTAETITRMLANFQTLLTAIVSHPDDHISSLPLLTPAEKNKLLVEWNNTQASYPLDICLHQLFEQQVTKTPDAVAVIFETQITYTQLNQQANKLAHYLQHLGVEKDVLVGICLERSLYMVVGLLAILKAGGAYVPIDPSYPKTRRDLIILDAGLQIILTQQHLRSSLSNHTAQLICLDTEWDKDHPLSNQDSPISNSTPDSLAYVIYTSGSTGTPKGAMNTHRGICNRLQWMQETYQLTPDDAVLQKTPFSFDVSVWEFFWTLITGARLIIAVPGGHLDSRYLVKTISHHNITIIHFVPSMLQVFLEDPEIATLTSLRQVICSGEALPVSLQTKFFTQLSAKLDNLYGPTEAAIDVTYWQCQPDSNLTTVPIGRPIANTQIYILDKHLQPLPIGVTGELYIAGVGVARGYLNRPQLSCEKFIQVPGKFVSPLYKTGDLARYLSDGNIEYRGRIDNQIKLRGFRIELGEIEAVLSNYPGVREAVVIVKELSQSLIAYLVLAHPKTTIEKIRCQLKQQLPEYMIPNAFVVLEALPLTSNGKVNRLALGDLDLEVSSYLAPSTPVQEILTGIWSVILNVEGVGIEDNFFELGGHSLLATQVISQVRQIWGVEIALKEIFSAPTIAQFSLLIENARNSWQHLPIKASNRDRNIPLSFAQQRLWFLQQLEPDSIAYNGSNLILITGLLNVEALEKSINEIARRHEILRTSFIFRDNQAVQEIAEELFIPLEIIDLENLSKIEQQTAIKRIIAASSNQPFKLTQAPLFRVSLIKLKSDKQLLLLTIHHIISDAWSAGIFIKEISALYAAFSTGKQSPLPELPIQYADFALWQREWLQGEFLERQLSYWQQQLENANSNLKLPRDISCKQVSAIGKQHHFSLPSELSQQLTSFSQQQGVTLFMTLLTIYNTLLYSYNQQEDISIGSPIANRNRSEIEGLIGFFVNTLVLRTNLANNPTFTQLLQRVRTTALDAYAHQDVPFEKIVAALKPVRDKGKRSPLFQVWFVLQNAPTPTLQLAGLDLSLIDVETGIVRHDLKLDLTKTESGIQGFFEYKQDLFSEEVIAHLTQRFITISSLIVRDSEIKLKELVECLI
ncbi:amino acid adenylation domain-containing protein [Chondrocystis sp. NIES-4102]|nr:amino acid adenylation domain-containing protein [Chondrocystis sp. NIES-4102]